MPSAFQKIDELLARKEFRHRSRTRRGATLKSGQAAENPLQAAIPRQRSRQAVKSKIEVVKAVVWRSESSWLLHGFSTRTGGVSTVYRPGQRAGELNLGLTA